MSSVYDHPKTYDQEHNAPEEDISFFVGLLRRFKPLRTLDLACGNGRLTIPLAKAAQEWGGEVDGADSCQPMLESAKEKPDAHLVTFKPADARDFSTDVLYDLVIAGCSSFSHLLKLEDQINAWANVSRALRPGGRFVIAEAAPDYHVMADALTVPPKTNVQLDGDFCGGGGRLIRYRTSAYHSHLQKLDVHYLYDQMSGGESAERFVNDYEAHVFFPNELRLLFLMSGFEIEAEWGSYQETPLSHESRVLLFCGVRTSS